jgi:hypothetical protein
MRWLLYDDVVIRIGFATIHFVYSVLDFLYPCLIYHVVQAERIEN